MQDFSIISQWGFFVYNTAPISDYFWVTICILHFLESKFQIHNDV